jgi:hypothetical protein
MRHSRRSALQALRPYPSALTILCILYIHVYHPANADRGSESPSYIESGQTSNQAPGRDLPGIGIELKAVGQFAEFIATAVLNITSDLSMNVENGFTIQPQQDTHE